MCIVNHLLHCLDGSRWRPGFVLITEIPHRTVTFRKAKRHPADMLGLFSLQIRPGMLGCPFARKVHLGQVGKSWLVSVVHISC